MIFSIHLSQGGWLNFQRDAAGETLLLDRGKSGRSLQSARHQHDSPARFTRTTWSSRSCEVTRFHTVFGARDEIV